MKTYIKPLLLALVIALGVVGGMTLVPPKEVTVEVTPTWASDPDAVKAAEGVIKKKALEAERDVLKNEVKERQTRIEAIEKELEN